MEDPLENIEITACTKIKYKDHANNEHIMYYASLQNGDQLIYIKNLNTEIISTIRRPNGSRDDAFQAENQSENHYYEELKKYEREQPGRILARTSELWKKFIAT